MFMWDQLNVFCPESNSKNLKSGYLSLTYLIRTISGKTQVWLIQQQLVIEHAAGVVTDKKGEN